jgi:arabinogalactan oligomer/maltooligosaccharide transport system permease protein
MSFIKETKVMPFYIWIPLSVWENVFGLFMKIFSFTYSLLLSTITFFYRFIFWMIKLFKNIYNMSVHYVNIFIHGDRNTKFSFVLMGWSAFVHKQYIKGLLYFLVQIGIITSLFTVFWKYLIKFNTLGTELTRPTQFDEVCNCYLPAVIGDNSMLVLLFSIAAFLLLFGLLYVYTLNIETAYRNQLESLSGKKPQGFKKDLDELLNSRFHVTVLTFPSIFAFTFTILPLIFMILLAFTNFDRSHQPPGTLFTWVGLDNFLAMFSGQVGIYQYLPGTLSSILQWSLVWAFFATFSNYFFGIVLALMINKKGIKFKKLWRTAFVITIAIPQFISLLVMNFFLNDLGPLNNFFVEMGWVNEGFSFLGVALNARITVIIVNLWVGVPYTMLMTSGILMNIPQDLYESATIDGAGTFTKFFKITLPYMLFVTGPSLLTAFIGNINSFGVIYFLTGGGPSSQTLFQAGETDLLVTWLFKLTLFNQDYKMASTLGIIIFVISSFISLVMFSKIKGVKDEEAFQ